MEELLAVALRARSLARAGHAPAAFERRAPHCEHELVLSDRSIVCFRTVLLCPLRLVSVMTVNVAGVVSVVLFYVLILAVGIWAGKKKTPHAAGEEELESEEVMLAGRNIGVFVGIFTMTATWVGGGYINGTAEVLYSSGVIWCQAPFGYAASLVVGGLFFATQMREQGYVTMLDPFQEVLGSRMGGLLFLPALCGEIFWSAAILAALGATVSVIIDMDNNTAIVLSAGVALVYTLFGGLYSVAYTDVIQLFMIFVGLWLCVPFSLAHPAVKSMSSDVHDWIGELPGDEIGRYVDYGLLLTLGGVPWQVYFQRVLSTRTARKAQLLSYVAAIGCLLMAIPPVIIGAIGRVTAWNETEFAGPLPLDKAHQSLVLPLVLQVRLSTRSAFRLLHHFHFLPAVPDAAFCVFRGTGRRVRRCHVLVRLVAPVRQFHVRAERVQADHPGKRVRTRSRVGHESGDRRRRRRRHLYGPVRALHLRALVPLLRFGLRHPLPAARVRRPLQSLLQHIWLTGGIRHRPAAARTGRRGDTGTAAVDQVSLLRPGQRPALSLSHVRNALLTLRPPLRHVPLQTPVPVRLCAAAVRLLPLRHQHPGRRRRRAGARTSGRTCGPAHGRQKLPELERAGEPRAGRERGRGRGGAAEVNAVGGGRRPAQRITRLFHCHRIRAAEKAAPHQQFNGQRQSPSHPVLVTSHQCKSPLA